MEATDNTSWLRGLIPSAAGPCADPHMAADERESYNLTGTGISIGAGVGMAVGRGHRGWRRHGHRCGRRRGVGVRIRRRAIATWPVTDTTEAPTLRVAHGQLPASPARAGGETASGSGWRRLRWVIGVLVSTIAVVWVGLRVDPAPFAAVDLQAGAVSTVGVPADLPEPVARFYTALYADAVPVIDSAVISGRGSMRISGVTLPVRFRFSHLTGEAYRHHIQTTIYGARMLTVNEWFLDGGGRLELPFGVSEGLQIDQGANLALWAEAVWMPSAWITDDRVRWEAIDATSARLLVPFGDAVETFTVIFDPTTGLLQRMESMRFKGATDEVRTGWINEVVEWGELEGQPVPLVTSLTWADEESPWAILRTEAMIRNADLTTYIQQAGP